MISRWFAWIGLLAGAVVLSGCMAGGGIMAGLSGDAPRGRAPDRVQVMSKSFTIAAPRGYCIDEVTTRETAEGSFVMLGSCAVISGNPRDAKPAAAAVLTALVAPAAAQVDDVALDRMAGFLISAEGRPILARAEAEAPVEVLDVQREAGLLMIRARDGAREGKVAGDYWRGVFGAGGRLVSVTVSGFRDAPLEDATATAILRDFAAAIRRANGQAPGAPASPAGAGLAGLLDRLL